MQKISPFLWFDDQAEEAVNFYISLFSQRDGFPKNSKVGTVANYNEAAAAASGKPAGGVMTVSFQLDGNEFTAINGGPAFKFNPSVSLVVLSKDEKEIEALWKKLIDGGKVLMELDKYDWSKKYGWLEDKYGLSWQLMITDDEIKHNLFPSLLFVDKNYGKADEAIKFYTSVFKNANVENVFKYGPDDKQNKENAVMYGDFILEGKKFAAMDGAGEHGFQFNEALSFIVNCDNQEEIDYYWNTLTSDGGAESMCGWLKDKFGVSWQIVPAKIDEWLSSKEPGKSQRVMQKVLEMKKLDISELENA
jgi:predicted 3-demethylubiquinone-9 3-methyltransferase (glyoxalase superfamily)